jgi:hypothetical protein
MDNLATGQARKSQMVKYAIRKIVRLWARIRKSPSGSIWLEFVVSIYNYINFFFDNSLFLVRHLF